tara:strand:+ start:2437 stop:2739 length:303 start_codon:yes stop_codon:yes gene_type:complete
MDKIKFIEIEDDEWNSDVPDGMKRVDVSVFWRWEQGKSFDIPEDVELSELASQIREHGKPSFEFDQNDLSEFKVSMVADRDGDEWKQEISTLIDGRDVLL